MTDNTQIRILLKFKKANDNFVNTYKVSSLCLELS